MEVSSCGGSFSGLGTGEKKLIEGGAENAETGADSGGRDFVGEGGRFCEGFVVVFEKGDVVEVVLRDEGLEMAEFLLRFAGEADDEVGADVVDGELGFDEVEEVTDCFFVVESSHSTQDGGSGMLEGDVEIGDELLEGSQLF